ncbi:MAG: hypothetical protein AB8F95_12100 [Bacteroidia bacterium]
MKSVTLCIVSLMWCLNLIATDYHFVANEDHQYVNPANWTPSYPGVEIQENDRVFIDTDAVYEGLNLEINGSLEIAIGATLSSASGELRVRESGVCNTYGTLRVKGLRVWGAVLNNTPGRFMLTFLAVRSTGSLSNFPGATVSVKGDLANLGKFLNYGHVSVGNNVILMKTSAFHQIGRAELLVRGTLTAAPDAMLEQAPESYVQIAEVTP